MTNPQQHRQTTGGCFALLHRPTARTPVRWAQSYKITNRSRPARSTNCAARPGRQSGSAIIGNISSVMNRHTNGLPTTLSTIRHSGVRIRCGERRGKASAILPSPAGVPSTRAPTLAPVRGERLQCSQLWGLGHGRAFDNICTERLWRSLTYEDIYLNNYPSVPDLTADLER